MKKIVFAILMLFLICGSVFAVDVKLNDSYIDFTDSEGNVVNATIINDRTMVPMRKIFEILNCQVSWDDQNKIVTATSDDKIITLQIGNEKASIKNISDDEVKEIILDSVPVILDNRTLVPVRFIAETLGLQVGWDEKLETVIIIDYSFAEKYIQENAPTFYTFINSEFEIINSAEYDVKIDGTLKYYDLEEKSNNEYVDLSGDAKIEFNKDALKIYGDLELDGNGEIAELIETQKMDNIEYDIIFDNVTGNCYYMANGSEFTKINLGTDNINLMISNNMKNAILLDESTLDVDSFDYLKEMLSIYCEIYSDENFSVRGSSTKTYSFEYNFSDLIMLLGEGIMSEDLRDFDANIDFEMIVKNNVVKKETSNIDFTYEMAESSEKITVELEIISTLDSYNDEIEIEIPKM